MSRLKNYKLRWKYRKIIPFTSYLTHGMHTYTAKLIPHIPRYFIENYTSEGNTILDPFCGSGTALLEGKLLRRNTIGIDINPLAVLLSEVKTKTLDIENLSSAINLVKRNLKNGNGRRKVSVVFPNIDYWFCKKAQNELSRIKFSIENFKSRFNKSIYKFLLVCFSSIVRKSSYADPRMAKTYRSKMVLKKIRDGWKPTPIKYFERALDKNFEKIKFFSEKLKLNNNYGKAFQGDAKKISVILRKYGIKKVDFIITSPPYINAQDYFRSYKLELWWLGLATPEEVRNLNKQAIGTERISGINYNYKPKSEIRILASVLNKIWKINKRKAYIIYNYFENINIIFREAYEVLKNSGHFCLITGNNTICEIKIPTYKIIIRLAKNNRFGLVEIGKDKIRYRSLPPARNHNGGIIKEEWITVFKKR